MNWFRISKKKSPSKQSNYTGWKQELRIEARYQCCYCSIHESEFGGLRNYAVEHYRPKKKYPLLKLKYANLFYACSICNSFKGDDWPTNRPHPNVACYLDPSQHDYRDHIAVSSKTALVRGLNAAGRYKVQRLHLNRKQLILNRRARCLALRIKRLNQFMRSAENQVSARERSRYFQLIHRAHDALQKLREAPPYEVDDLT